MQSTTKPGPSPNAARFQIRCNKPLQPVDIWKFGNPITPAKPDNKWKFAMRQTHRAADNAQQGGLQREHVVGLPGLARLARRLICVLLLEGAPHTLESADGGTTLSLRVGERARPPRG